MNDQPIVEYYSHSYGELVLLFIIISLWLIVLFFSYKRYKKITSIERADMPRYEKQSDQTTSKVESSASCSSIPGQLNRVQNLSNENLQSSRDTNRFPNYLGQVNSHKGTIGTSEPNYPKKQLSSNYSLFNTTNSCANNIHNPSSSTNYSHMRLNNPNNNSISVDKCSSATTNSRLDCLNHNFRQQINSKYEHRINPNVTRTLKYPCKVYKTKTLLTYAKTNTTSYSNYDLVKVSATSNRPPMPKATSEPLIVTPLLELDKSDNVLLMPQKSCVDSTHLMMHQKKIPDSSLLNPKLIPRSVRKSLIDLHKKSMCNLAHKATQLSSFGGPGGLSVLNTRLNGGYQSHAAQTSNSRSKVFTQQRNPNETRMNVNENCV